MVYQSYACIINTIILHYLQRVLEREREKFEGRLVADWEHVYFYANKYTGKNNLKYNIQVPIFYT